MLQTNQDVHYDYGPHSPTLHTNFSNIETSHVNTTLQGGPFSPTDTYTPPMLHSPMVGDATPNLFYAQPPDRLSPHASISTFSTLTGWDGGTSDTMYNPTELVPAPKPSPWHHSTTRWGTVQSDGLQHAEPCCDCNNTHEQSECCHNT